MLDLDTDSVLHSRTHATLHHTEALQRRHQSQWDKRVAENLIPDSDELASPLSTTKIDSRILRSRSELWSSIPHYLRVLRPESAQSSCSESSGWV